MEMPLEDLKVDQCLEELLEEATLDEVAFRRKA